MHAFLHQGEDVLLPGIDAEQDGISLAGVERRGVRSLADGWRRLARYCGGQDLCQCLTRLRGHQFKHIGEHDALVDLERLAGAGFGRGGTGDDGVEDGFHAGKLLLQLVALHGAAGNGDIGRERELGCGSRTFAVGREYQPDIGGQGEG